MWVDVGRCGRLTPPFGWEAHTCRSSDPRAGVDGPQWGLPTSAGGDSRPRSVGELGPRHHEHREHGRAVVVRGLGLVAALPAPTLLGGDLGVEESGEVLAPSLAEGRNVFEPLGKQGDRLVGHGSGDRGALDPDHVRDGQTLHEQGREGFVLHVESGDVGGGVGRLVPLGLDGGTKPCRGAQKGGRGEDPVVLRHDPGGEGCDDGHCWYLLSEGVWVLV